MKHAKTKRVNMRKGRGNNKEEKDISKKNKEDEQESKPVL